MRPNSYIYQNNTNDRFVFPFLVGALTGGAAIGLTRPRPIYNVAPSNQGQFYPTGPYGQSSYSYYYPTPYMYSYNQGYYRWFCIFIINPKKIK